MGIRKRIVWSGLGLALLMAACPGDPSGSVPAQDLPERNIVMDAGGPNPADGSADMGAGPVDASTRSDVAARFPDTVSDPDATAETDSNTSSPADATVTDNMDETDLDALGELHEVPADASPPDDGIAPPDALPETSPSDNGIPPADTTSDAESTDSTTSPAPTDVPDVPDVPDILDVLDTSADASDTTTDATTSVDVPAETTPGPGYADNLRVLAHNVYMLDELLFDWSQTERAPLIAAADYMQGHDVVLLQELFDNSAREVLLDALAVEYPHQTPVMGMSTAGWDSSEGANFNLFVEDGGIAIVSKWPIVEQVQYVQNAGCGADAFSAKGFVYAKIDKEGSPYHLISTHTQSQDSGCADGQPEAIRATQFQAIRDWVAARNIPSDELVVIGGDFNVIKGTVEYDTMWANLGATVPDTYVGVPYTWDPISNSIAYYNYPELAGEYLDYVVVSADHAQPSHWHNLALDPVSPVWTANVGLVPYRWYEYSDHYPVAGFAYADAWTPTKSERPIASPYAAVDLQNAGNGLYVQADSGDPDGWLYADAANPGDWTEHILERWHDPLSGCIRSGDYVTLRPSARPDHYWTWWLWLPNDGGYYTEQDNPVDRLRLEIMEDDGSCLAAGDTVALRDQWTPTLTDYYVSRASDDRLFLEASAVGTNERFVVVNAAAPTYIDWSSLLVY